MKTTLRAKLLQHLAGKKKADEGFTLIELLVVIIIIGILAAIALPSFLNQANKARQTEATTNVGAINRGQQAYVLEEAHFADTISSLGIGIKVESENYKFGDGTESNELKGMTGNAVVDHALGDTTQYLQGAVIIAQPENPTNLKAYIGATYLLSETTTGEVTSTTILCEKDTAGAAPTANGEIFSDVQNLAARDTVVDCADGFSDD